MWVCYIKIGTVGVPGNEDVEETAKQGKMIRVLKMYTLVLDKCISLLIYVVETVSTCLQDIQIIFL